MTNQKTQKKKAKDGSFPMNFNPGLKKFVPVLPLRKGPLLIKKQVNWWSYWILLIIILIILFEVIYFSIN